MSGSFDRKDQHPARGNAETVTLEEGNAGDHLFEERKSLLGTRNTGYMSTKILSSVPQQTLMAGACFCLASGGMVRYSDYC